MKTEENTALTPEECQALFGTLRILTGGSPEIVFAWDGSDSRNDPVVRAWSKIFRSAGQSVPKEVLK